VDLIFFAKRPPFVSLSCRLYVLPSRVAEAVIFDNMAGFLVAAVRKQEKLAEKQVWHPF
jgi:hypothetical protein